jgi:hypothetical protein
MRTNAGPVPLAHLDMTVADGRVRGVGAVRRHAVAQAQIVAAGYTSLEAETLVDEVLERLAGSQPTDPDTT